MFNMLRSSSDQEGGHHRQGRITPLGVIAGFCNAHSALLPAPCTLQTLKQVFVAVRVAFGSG